jgi:hypothetical protein
LPSFNWSKLKDREETQKEKKEKIMAAKKRKPFNKSTGRDTTTGTDAFHNRKNTANRSLRNQARRVMKAHLTKKHGASKAEAMMKGKHVGHKRPLTKGGTNAVSNLVLEKASANLGTDRPMGKRKRSKGKLKK